MEYYSFKFTQIKKQTCIVTKQAKQQADKLPVFTLKRSFVQTTEQIKNKLCHPIFAKR